MRRNEVRSLLEVRASLEVLCVELAVEKAGDAELEALSPILDALQSAPDADKAAEAVFSFHHELAVLSGNVLLPLMYYSFRPQSEYLWGLFCRDNGIQPLYEIKLSLYTALLNRDAAEAARQTEEVMGRAIDNLSVYGV